MSVVKVSSMDVEHLNVIRESVEEFVAQVVGQWEGRPARVLEVAPQSEGSISGKYLRSPLQRLETLDLNPAAKCTYTGDLCKRNEGIPDGLFDLIICTEVLEHTLNPFLAVNEICRLLKSEGVVAVTTPFNFRIHGPLPDCWRFTEHGLRALFADFDILSLDQLDTPGRDLMPIHYRLTARKKRD